MQIITRGKTAQSDAKIPPGCPLHDAVYQEHIEKEVHPGARFERFLDKLTNKAHRICEQHHLPEHSPVIIIMDWVAFNSPEALTPIKLHQCRDHPSQYLILNERDARTSQIC